MYGANVMKGYLGRDDLTQKKIIDGGWYITGDLAFIDEEGFITITGREERFAKVGGEMVPLEKVEEEMHAILKTNDKMCAVTAIPDAKKGERIIVLHLPLAGDDAAGACGSSSASAACRTSMSRASAISSRSRSCRSWARGKLDLKKCKQMAQAAATGGGE